MLFRRRISQIQHVHPIWTCEIFFAHISNLRFFPRQSSLALRISTAINNRDAFFRCATALYSSFTSLSDDNLLMSSNQGREARVEHEKWHWVVFCAILNRKIAMIALRGIRTCKFSADLAWSQQTVMLWGFLALSWVTNGNIWSL